MFKGTLVNYNVMMNKILNYVKYKKKKGEEQLFGLDKHPF